MKYINKDNQVVDVTFDNNKTKAYITFVDGTKKEMPIMAFNKLYEPVSKHLQTLSEEELSSFISLILEKKGFTPELLKFLKNNDLKKSDFLQSLKGEKGDKGDPGKSGHTPIIFIGENGNWFIDGNDTGKKSQGDSGKPGHTPVITIGENGSWFIDGKDTGKKAQIPIGESVPIPGPKGDKGDPGHSPVISIRNGNWIIDGNDTGCPAQGPKGESCDTGFSGNSVKEFEIRNLKRTDINYLIDQILRFGANRLKGPQGPKGAPGVKGKVSPFIWVVIILLIACILYLGYSNYRLNEKIDKISNELTSIKTATPDNISSATTQYPDTSNTSVHDSLSMDSKVPVVDYANLLAQANRTVQTQKIEIRELKKRNKNLEDALKKITDKKS